MNKPPVYPNGEAGGPRVLLSSSKDRPFEAGWDDVPGEDGFNKTASLDIMSTMIDPTLADEPQTRQRSNPTSPIAMPLGPIGGSTTKAASQSQQQTNQSASGQNSGNDGDEDDDDLYDDDLEEDPLYLSFFENHRVRYNSIASFYSSSLPTSPDPVVAHPSMAPTAALPVINDDEHDRRATGDLNDERKSAQDAGNTQLFIDPPISSGQPSKTPAMGTGMSITQHQPHRTRLLSMSSSKIGHNGGIHINGVAGNSKKLTDIFYSGNTITNHYNTTSSAGMSNMTGISHNPHQSQEHGQASASTTASGAPSITALSRNSSSHQSRPQVLVSSSTSDARSGVYMTTVPLMQPPSTSSSSSDHSVLPKTTSWHDHTSTSDDHTTMSLDPTLHPSPSFMKKPHLIQPTVYSPQNITKNETQSDTTTPIPSTAALVSNDSQSPTAAGTTTDLLHPITRHKSNTIVSTHHIADPVSVLLNKSYESTPIAPDDPPTTTITATLPPSIIRQSTSGRHRPMVKISSNHKDSYRKHTHTPAMNNGMSNIFYQPPHHQSDHHSQLLSHINLALDDHDPSTPSHTPALTVSPMSASASQPGGAPPLSHGDSRPSQHRRTLSSGSHEAISPIPLQPPQDIAGDGDGTSGNTLVLPPLDTVAYEKKKSIFPRSPALQAQQEQYNTLKQSSRTQSQTPLSDLFPPTEGSEASPHTDNRNQIGSQRTHHEHNITTSTTPIASTTTTTTDSNLLIPKNSILQLPSSTFLATLSRHEVRKHPHTSELYTEYEIIVIYPPLTWTLWRRYSEFEALHQDLKKSPEIIANRIKLPKFPPKKLFNRFSETFIADRKSLLTVYWDQLMSHIELLLKITSFLQFVGMARAEDQTKVLRHLQHHFTHIDALLAIAQEGDVILFHTQGVLQTIQRGYLGSHYDHVGVVVRIPDTSTSIDSLYLFESTTDGANIYPLRRRLQAWSDSGAYIVYRQLHIERTLFRKRRLYAFVTENEGKPYSIAAAKVWRNRYLKSKGKSKSKQSKHDMTLPTTQSAPSRSRGNSSNLSHHMEQPNHNAPPLSPSSTSEMQQSNMMLSDSLSDSSSTTMSGKTHSSTSDGKANPLSSSQQMVSTASEDDRVPSYSSYFCSELVSAALIAIGALTNEREPSSYLPASFSDAYNHTMPYANNAVLDHECLIEFKTPEILYAQKVKMGSKSTVTTTTTTISAPPSQWSDTKNNFGTGYYVNRTITNPHGPDDREFLRRQRMDEEMDVTEQQQPQQEQDAYVSQYTEQTEESPSIRPNQCREPLVFTDDDDDDDDNENEHDRDKNNATDEMEPTIQDSAVDSNGLHSEPLKPTIANNDLMYPQFSTSLSASSSTSSSVPCYKGVEPLLHTTLSTDDNGVFHNDELIRRPSVFRGLDLPPDAQIGIKFNRPQRSGSLFGRTTPTHQPRQLPQTATAPSTLSAAHTPSNSNSNASHAPLPDLFPHSTSRQASQGLSNLSDHQLEELLGHARSRGHKFVAELAPPPTIDEDSPMSAPSLQSKGTQQSDNSLALQVNCEGTVRSPTPSPSKKSQHPPHNSSNSDIPTKDALNTTGGNAKTGGTFKRNPQIPQSDIVTMKMPSGTVMHVTTTKQTTTVSSARLPQLNPRNADPTSQPKSRADVLPVLPYNAKAVNTELNQQNLAKYYGTRESYSGKNPFVSLPSIQQQHQSKSPGPTPQNNKGNGTNTSATELVIDEGKWSDVCICGAIDDIVTALTPRTLPGGGQDKVQMKRHNDSDYDKLFKLYGDNINVLYQALKEYQQSTDEIPELLRHQLVHASFCPLYQQHNSNGGSNTPKAIPTITLMENYVNAAPDSAHPDVSRQTP